MSPDTCAGFEIALGHLGLFALLSFLLSNTGFGKLSFKVAGVDLLGLLLLLLQS